MPIVNPNSCGQGYDADHTQHPLHATVVKYGYTYSHSTPIHTLDNTVYTHHTYKFGEHNVGLSHSDKWHTSVSTASGHKWSGKGVAGLDAHLKSKQRRYSMLRQ